MGEGALPRPEQLLGVHHGVGQLHEQQAAHQLRRALRPQTAQFRVRRGQREASAGGRQVQGGGCTAGAGRWVRVARAGRGVAAGAGCRAGAGRMQGGCRAGAGLRVAAGAGWRVQDGTCRAQGGGCRDPVGCKVAV